MVSQLKTNDSGSNREVVRTSFFVCSKYCVLTEIMVHVVTLGLVITYVVVCGAHLKLDYMKHGEIQLECVFKWGYAFDWYRNESVVIKTKGSIFNRAHYEVLTDSLKNRTNLGENRRVIWIRTIPEDYNSYWKCCTWLPFSEKCSETVTIQKDNTVNKSVSSKTEIETEVINQTWTIQSSPQVPTEGENITLICTFDKPMDEEMWLVFWWRDQELLFVNNRSSSFNTNNFSDYFGFETGSPLGTEENVKPDVAVSSDDTQQNITFSASTELLNGHLWKCGNPFLEIGSNNLTISLVESSVTTATTTTATTPTTTTTATTTTATIPSTTATSQTVTTSTTSTTVLGRKSLILVGGIAGGTFIVLVCVITTVTLLCRSRRSKNQETMRVDMPSFEINYADEIVMMDNAIYGEGEDKNDRPVMLDNIIYDFEEDKRERPVMMDNVIYDVGEDKSERFENNVLYESSP